MVFFLILLSLCSLYWFVNASCKPNYTNSTEVIHSLSVTLLFAFLAGITQL